MSATEEPQVAAAATPPDKPKAVAKADKHIVGIFIALCIISIIELYSASSREVAGSSLGVMGPILRHFIMLLGGSAIVWYFSRWHYSKFIPFTVGFALISVAMMVYVMFFGEYINGARRSMSLLGISIFPAELVKISAVLLISLVMAWNPNPKKVGVTTNAVIISGIIVLLLSGLLLEQGLSNTLLLLSFSFSMMLVGGVKIKHIIVLLLTYAILGSAFVIPSTQTESTHGATASNAAQTTPKKTPTARKSNLKNGKSRRPASTDKKSSPTWHKPTAASTA